MIKYKLECKNCELTFDSWFASSKEYENLKKKKLLVCYNCDSSKIEKTLMAPQLAINNEKSEDNLDHSKHEVIRKTIKNYQRFIKKNFKDVGKNFAHEARVIHYDGKDRSKGIYGSASNDDLKELKEEGIKIQTIPWLNDKDN